MQDFARRSRPCLPLISVIAVFLLSIVLIGPFWETAFSDDWAFARMSNHLLQTGDYVQNAWLAPNSPIHVYWGALFSSIGGMSFGSLRLATLSLMLVSVVSLYFLAREFEIDSAASALLILVVAGSPLVLLMAFTFMSDVPFLTFLTLALLFLCRGIRREDYRWMLAGSAAAAAAILIRQLGAILLPALLIAWFLSKDRTRHIALYLICLPLPLLALGWLISQPQSWALRWVTLNQGVYLQNPQLFLPQAIWRVMVTLQYLAFLLPALGLAALVEVGELLRKSRGRKAYEKDLWLIIGFTVFVLGMSLFGSFVMGERGIIPMVPWNLNDLTKLPPIIPAVVTLFTTFGAVALGRIFCIRYLDRKGAAAPAHEYLLDFTALGLFVVNLFGAQIGDRYFIPLIPYAVIVAGRFLSPWLNRLRGPLAAASLGVMLISGLWIRAALSERAAGWNGAESIRAQGIPPEDIIGPDEWNMIHGSFDAYVKSIGGEMTPQSQDNYFLIWRASQLKSAEYRTTASAADLAEPGWKVIATFPYRDILLQEHQVYVQQRSEGK